MRDYWRRICNRAFKETAATLGLDSTGRLLIRVVVAVVGIALLWLVGSENAATNEIILKSVATAIILLVFPGVFIWKMISVPAEEDVEKSHRIIKLEEAAKPKLIIRWGEGQPYLGLTRFGAPKPPMSIPYEQLVYRIGVHNKSTNATIENVYVNLENVGKYVPHISLPARLRRMDTNDDHFDLAPGATEYVDVAHMIDLGVYDQRNGKKKQIILCLADTKKARALLQDEYILKIKVYGRNVPPAIGFFRLYVENDKVLPTLHLVPANQEQGT